MVPLLRQQNVPWRKDLLIEQPRIGRVPSFCAVQTSSYEFIAYDDDRMIATTDAVWSDLDRDGDGLLRRYDGDDSLEGEEGVFVACSFWLVECLARQGRLDEGRRVFDRAIATANDLGLFAEEYDPARAELLGNFPQGISHFSHVAAAVALDQASQRLAGHE